MSPRRKAIIQYLRDHGAKTAVQLAEGMRIELSVLRVALQTMYADDLLQVVKGKMGNRANYYAAPETPYEEVIAQMPVTGSQRERVVALLRDEKPRTTAQMALALNLATKYTGKLLNDLNDNGMIWRVDGIRGIRDHYYSIRIIRECDLPPLLPKKSVLTNPEKREVNRATVLKRQATREANRLAEVDADKYRRANMPAVVSTPTSSGRKVTFSDHWKPNREGIQRAGGSMPGYASALTSIDF